MTEKKTVTPRGKARTTAASRAEAEPSAAKVQAPPSVKPESAARVRKVEKAFPIVGIGASAGGLKAFEAFFSAMPPDVDPGMAFVLVQHLAPDHKSILTELIQRYTRMKVFEARDGMAVKANCAYIIPPNRDMAFLNGVLQLFEPSKPHGQRLPIDFFFRSLAQDQRGRAICIVLSGTGSDGTQGVRAIKNEGGMVMAQTPDSTEYAGMPSSAIATGLVDFELPPSQMPGQLIAYAAQALGGTTRVPTAAVSGMDNALKKIAILVRAQTGHDFSQYKPNTIHRRIERRMAVHQINAVADYVAFLQQTPTEVEALFRDLLIGVTHFFRDLEAFKALEEQVLSRMFSDRPAGAKIRVWAPGCSTGEEAYSIAILLHEQMEALKLNHKVQVFATDIDGQAISSARSGRYSPSIADNLSSERLARFFTAESEGGAYRINKVIRDMLVFSEHDLIKDPPFSRLDLISCRNLLIYMSGDLQKKVIPLFHYALNPGGFLFLGTSETVGDFGELFKTLDRHARLYQRQGDALNLPARMVSRAPLLATWTETAPLAGIEKRNSPPKQSLRTLTEKALLQLLDPVAALVNDQGDILYLHGRTGQYLELPPGEAGINNILTMAREGLRRELTIALHKAVETHERVSRSNLRVNTHGDFSGVNLTIRPVKVNPGAKADEFLHLVLLEAAPQPAAVGVETPREKGGRPPRVDARLAALQQELKAKEEYLNASNEALETSNEELKSSNEEMQSVNEELQSTNEELETSKEELQSLNEELATVNAELQIKVTDLSRSNNDMNNLLAGTGVGTIFVDQELRILRFTPTVTRIINLILGDVGRPVGHIVSNLVGYDRLQEDVREVLDTLVAKEVQVQAKDGKWYTMGIQLYRTLDNVIEGAVVTFVDTTDAKRAEASLRVSEAHFRQLSESLPQLAWTSEPDGTCDNLGPQWAEFTGLPGIQSETSRWFDKIHPEDRKAAAASWKAAIEANVVFSMAFRLLHRDGKYRCVEAQVMPLHGQNGSSVKWFALGTDTTLNSMKNVTQQGRKQHCPGSGAVPSD